MKSYEDNISEYQSLCHAMQAGVAMKMNFDPAETTPKHLRVGVNAALCDSSALARLLIEKGIITKEEHAKAIRDEMEREVERYQTYIRSHVGGGVNIKLG